MCEGNRFRAVQGHLQPELLQGQEPNSPSLQVDGARGAGGKESVFRKNRRGESFKFFFYFTVRIFSSFFLFNCVDVKSMQCGFLGLCLGKHKKDIANGILINYKNMR